MPSLIDLSGLSDDECYEAGEKVYADTFLNQSSTRGEINTHDGAAVVFHADRFEHAFRTSHDRARRAHDKSKVARDRIERLHWIAKAIRHDEVGLVCKEMRPPPRWQRAYYTLEHGYIVWLEAGRVEGGRPVHWRFSTAYPIPAVEIKRITSRGVILRGVGAP